MRATYTLTSNVRSETDIPSYMNQKSENVYLFDVANRFTQSVSNSEKL